MDEAGVYITRYLKDYRGLRWVCINCDKEVAIRASKISEQSTQEINKRIDQLEEKIKTLLEGKSEQKLSELPNKEEKLTWSKVVTIMPKARKGKEMSNTREKVRRKIDPTIIQASEIRNTMQGGVKFNCKAKNSNELESVIKEKLGANFDIKISDRRRPKLKIVGIYDQKNLNMEEYEKIIKKQNDEFVSKDDHFKIVKVSPGRTNKDVKTLIAEVDVDVYERLVEVGKININWSRCRVMDAVDVMRCYKCSRYSHRGSVCTQEKCCPKCMGPHTLTEHEKEDEEEKCINCHEANEKFNLGLNNNHAVWSRSCEVYKRKLNTVKKSFKM
jgi:hypothetical protein